MTQLNGLSPQQKRELLAKLLKQKSDLPKSPPTEFPMSAGQQGLWYAFRRDPSVTAYNVFLPSRFRSPIDVDALRQSTEQLVERHRCLRTVFDEDAETHKPVQRVLQQSRPEFQVTDATGWDDQTLRDAVLAEVERPFDLSNGPLLRVRVFCVAEDDFVVLATTHHIVVDFWSLVLMMDEVRQLYPSCVSDTVHTLPSAPENYHRFVESQSAIVNHDEGRRLGEYWARQLSGTRPVLEWPTDYDRPARFSHRADIQTLQFSNATAKGIASLARLMNVTPNVVMMAMLQVLIARQTTQHSFSIGTPFSGRLEHEFEKTVGFFVNMLPIAADVSDAPTLQQLIGSVGETMVGALEHEALPFSEIVRQNAPGRDASRHPLFQVSCTFEKSQLASEKGRAGFLLGDNQSTLDFAGLRQESFFVPHPTCHYDVEFIFEILDDSVSGMICYCTDLFSTGTIETMARQFVVLVEALLAEPDRDVFAVPWVKSPVLVRPDNNVHSPCTISQLLAEVDHPILFHAIGLAKELQDAGVRVGDVVPVCSRQGAHAWGGILGVMLAGGVAVPIDSGQPSVKLEDLASDSSVRFAITDSSGSEWVTDTSIRQLPLKEDNRAEAGSAVAQPDPVAASLGERQTVGRDDLAYVIYTSGSTGRSKGVMVQHQAICNTLQWRKKAGTLREDDRVLVLVSHQFDASLAVVLSTLHHNATPVWPSDPTNFDLDEIVELIIEERITVLPAVPSLLRSLAQHPRFRECTSIRSVWSGGESMSNDLLRMIRRYRDVEYWNFYGPTEAAVEATAKRVDQLDDRQEVSIGKAIDGAEVFLLDDRLQSVPDGVPGQIAIAGRGLALGYLNRPELTRKAFVESEYLRHCDGSPVRMYLTGDRGRFRQDGDLEFLGRLDHQVKLRGYRIELEEIERTIQSAQGVVRAATKVVFPGTPRESLAAYVEVDSSFEINALRQYLSNHLPVYKRPQSILVLDQLPTGTSGKVARDRLPVPASNSQEERFVAPDTELERYLCRRFEDTLELEQVSVDANFFEYGGTSLQAAMLTSQLSSELELSVPTSLLFDLGDVRTVAARLVALYESEIAARFGLSSVEFANSQMESQVEQPLLAKLKTTGDKTPVFMIHPPGGIVLCYREIASQLEEGRPLIAVRSRGLHGDEDLPATIQEMAAEYVQAIESVPNVTNYVVGGWSLGGVIAYEVARQLISRGHSVDRLVLLDSTVPERSDEDGIQVGQEYGIELTLKELNDLSDSQQLPMLYKHAEQLGVLDDETPGEVVEKVLEDLRSLFAHHVRLCESYRLKPLDVPVMLLRPSETPVQADPRPDRGWNRWTGDVTVHTVTGHHHSMIKGPGATQIAALLS